MSGERVFEVEFHNGNVTIWAILPVPEVGQDDTEPVRKRLQTYDYSELPVTDVRIDDVRGIVAGEQAADSIALQVGDVELGVGDPGGEAEHESD
jgi:hypothetical protein